MPDRWNFIRWLIGLALAALLLPVACEQPSASRAMADGLAKTEAKPPAQAPQAAPPAPAALPVPPNVAGGFYPADPGELKSLVQGHLADAKEKPPSNIWELIAPHAGYRYSGPIAGSAYRQVMGKPYTRVVIVAFDHNPYTPSGSFKTQGLGTISAPAFKLPGGDVPVDQAEVRELLRLYPFIREAPAMFEGEHSLEVQLPFIREALPAASIVPVLFANQSDPTLAEKLGRLLAERYASQPGTLVVASSDMSHYFPYETARTMDRRALDLVTALDDKNLLQASVNRQAEFCGLMPVLALVYAQKAVNGPKPVVADYRNSGDTAGDKSRVVGYGAVLFSRPEKVNLEPKEPRKGGGMDYSLSNEQKTLLLAVARKTVESFVRTGKKPEFDIKDAPLLEKGAAFVTLKVKGELRGCIGHTEPHLPLWQCVQEMAVAAASQDPRFPPVGESELSKLSYEVTVLTPVEKVKSVEEIRVGVDGLMMEKGYRRGLLLPQVPTEWGWNREEFLNHTAQKAGLPQDAWKDGSVTIYRFQGLIFSTAN